MEESYPKQLENTVGKGEIARYEQFLLFPQCFQKACSQGVSKGVIVWEWVNAHCRLLKIPGKKSFATIVWKVNKCGNQHMYFLIF